MNFTAKVGAFIERNIKDDALLILAEKLLADLEIWCVRGNGTSGNGSFALKGLLRPVN